MLRLNVELLLGRVRTHVHQSRRACAAGRMVSGKGGAAVRGPAGLDYSNASVLPDNDLGNPTDSSAAKSDALDAGTLLDVFSRLSPEDKALLRKALGPEERE